MSFRRRRRRLIMVLGLAVAAVGAGGAQANVIPYLSQGQGISSLQMAQLQNTTPLVESRYLAPSGGTTGPTIAVGGKYLDPANQYAPGSWNTPEFQADLDAISSRADSAVRPNDRPTHGPGAINALDPAISGVFRQQDGAVRPDDRANHGPLATTFEQPSTSASSGDGFSWSDAGVGAGSVLGALLVAGAAMLTFRRGRRDQLAGA
jgi:hypothetical protein